MNESELPVLELRNLHKDFRLKTSLWARGSGPVASVINDVGLRVHRGETLAVVGAAACGLSTLAKLVLGLSETTGGVIRLFGSELTAGESDAWAMVRGRVQLVMSDPRGSLNPRMDTLRCVSEPLGILGRSDDGPEQAAAMIERVGLDRNVLRRLPRELSEEECALVGIARAFVTRPDLVVLDDPFAGHDPGFARRLAMLLAELRDEMGASLLLLSHDLAAVIETAQRVSIMYLGSIVETARTDTLLACPAHPYTMSLVSHVTLAGDVPSPVDLPTGCTFRTLCWKAQATCAELTPVSMSRYPGHEVRCHFPVSPAPA